MHTVIFSLFIFLTLIIISNIDCRICTKREVFTTKGTELRYFTYLIPRTRCDPLISDCEKPIVETGNRLVEVTKRIVRVVSDCCDGYVRTDSGYDFERIECQPSCVPSCVNGRCEQPGQCSCYERYAKDPSFQNKCNPICDDGCQHGICTSPDFCECKLGYQFINGFCSPTCTEPCENGTCVAPDTCECNPGYRKTESNTCEPYCFSGCEHGRCVGPDTCSCDDGWYITDDQRCISVCDPGCFNGRCVEENKCECFSDYEFEDGICQPKCKNCQGTCIGPYNCQCDLPFVAVDQTVEGNVCNCHFNCTDEDIECDKTVCKNPEKKLEQTISDDEAFDTADYSNITTSSDKEELLMKNSEQVESSTWNHWISLIMVISLLLLLIFLIFLVVSKWKYLVIYFKGGDYVVEDTRNDYESSQFVNVPLSSVPTKNI